MRKIALVHSFLAVWVVLILASCAQLSPKTSESLYKRLGGTDGITNIVDNLLFEIAGNEKLLVFFENTNIDRFRSKLIEQICQVSDGPCTYTGDSMAVSHSAMELNNSHFDALVTDLMSAMDDAGTPEAAQNDLLSRLVPMYDEVMYPQRYLPEP